MQDALSKIATAGTTPGVSGFVDISAASPQFTAVYNVGKTGLPHGNFTVHITEVTAQAVAPVQFVLQYTVDNGGEWKDLATITADVVSAKAVFSVPFGPTDVRTDQISKVEGDFDVRVKTTHTVVASADDISYDAYISGRNTFPAFN